MCGKGEFMNDAITLEIECNLKNELERTCNELGINISTAFTLFARKFINEQRHYDPFYSPSNIRYLEEITAEIDSGKAKLEEHALIEDPPLTDKQRKTLEKAKQGDAKAQNTVGTYYETGNGFDKDYDQAILWYTKAAKAGNTNAMYHLGVIYNKVKHDVRQSYTWFEVARSCGLTMNALLREYIGKLEAQLTPSQIKAANNDAQQKVKSIKQKAGK